MGKSFFIFVVGLFGLMQVVFHTDALVQSNYFAGHDNLVSFDGLEQRLFPYPRGIYYKSHSTFSSLVMKLH